MLALWEEVGQSGSEWILGALPARTGISASAEAALPCHIRPLWRGFWSAPQPSASSALRAPGATEVTTVRFRGEHTQRVDDKCRLAIPAAFRQALENAQERKLVLVRQIGSPCIAVWPMRRWEAYEDQIAALPQSDPRRRAVERYQVSASFDVEPDNHGRVVLPAALRAHAGIQASSEVVLSGQIHRFEIWNRDNWERLQQELAATSADWAKDLADLGL